MNKRVNTVLKIVFLVFFLLFVIAGCTLLGLDSKTKEIRELQASVKKITGGDLVVPLHEDYPLVSAYVSYPPLGTGINRIHLYYSVEKIELEYLFEDEAMKKMAEELSHLKYLYGPYRGGKPIWLTYWPPPANTTVVSNGSEKRSWIINGQEVGYDYVSRRGEEAVHVTLTIGKGSLFASYRLDDRFTEEDAESFTAYLMDFYQLETQY